MNLELLAPAGSIEGLRAVIAAGADAVYIGGSKFGARAYADNPDENDLREGIEYAHLRGVKVYLTVNTLLKDSEIPELIGYVRPFYEAGVDAVLVQDFGVLKILHTEFSNLPLHASTQMTVTGPGWANILKHYGVTRIVPARELSFDEIRRLKEESGLEVEVFVHGALCVCYSGQCLYSSMLGGRSGNRGRCAQPCRLLYLKNEDLKPGTSIVDNPRARHYLSPKDLNASGEIAELARAGADSLKIEGRMKRPEYAAGVTHIYRKYVDLVSAGKRARVAPEDSRKLYDLYNRSGFTDGYFTRHNGPEMMAMVKHELTPYETKKRADILDVMHRKYIDSEKKVPVKCVLEFYAGKTARLTYRVSGKNELPEKIKNEYPGPETAAASFTACSETPVDRARTRPFDEARLGAAMQKSGDTDFSVLTCEIHTDGVGFMPLSKLNDLRRQCLSGLRNTILKNAMPPGREPAAFLRSKEIPEEKIRIIENRIDEPESGGDRPLFPPETDRLTADGDLKKSKEKIFVTALCRTQEQLRAALHEPSVKRVISESVLFMYEEDPRAAAVKFIKDCADKGKESGIAFPYIERSEEGSFRSRCAAHFQKAVPELLHTGLSVLLVRATETLAGFLNAGFAGNIIVDSGIYTMNEASREFLRGLGAERDTAPFELNEKELFARDNTLSELVVYGRIPLMVTAQCIRKNTEKCLCPPGRKLYEQKDAIQKAEPIVLTDRERMKFQVKNECCFCYNIIYNSVPLYIIDEFDAIRKMGFQSVRLSFTEENAEETEKILKAARMALSGKKAVPDMPRTKGHFKRGVL